MEGNIASPAGEMHAWVPDRSCGCGFCGAEAHASTAEELAAKLAAKPRG